MNPVKDTTNNIQVFLVTSLAWLLNLLVSIILAVGAYCIVGVALTYFPVHIASQHDVAELFALAVLVWKAFR